MTDYGRVMVAGSDTAVIDTGDPPGRAGLRLSGLRVADPPANWVVKSRPADLS